MAPKARLRSRSSVEHIFELVEHLDENQLTDLLQDLNSTPDTNVPVSKGVEYFEEHRRTTLCPASPNVLRPTPSFLDQPHEPADWPRQKPRPVSGSQWRNNMRIVSSPYDSKSNSQTYNQHNGGLTRHQTEPISPPLTASPPLSPPLSPPKGLSSPARRSVTAPLPVRRGKAGVEIEAIELPLSRELTPPRDRLSPMLHDETDSPPRPSLSEFGSFNFGFDGAKDTATEQEKTTPEEPVSPQSRVLEAPAPVTTSQLPPLAPIAQPEFSRMQTMPLPSFHASEAMDIFSSQPLSLRPRTATGDASTASAFNKQRSFRRISRPVFLSPLSVPTPDDLAKKLSAYLFEDAPLSPPPPAPRQQTPPMAKAVPTSLEEMLKEPVTPRSRVVFGRVEREVPTSGIFQVLTEG